MSRVAHALALALAAGLTLACGGSRAPIERPGPVEPAAVDVSERIRRVESGLTLMHVVRGEAGQSMTIAERLRHHNVPGVSVAVVNDGRIEWARAWGAIEAGSGQPVDTLTLFQAASISKPVAAAAALQLVQEGVLSLDESVNKWLRTWTVPASAHLTTEAVTLRRLLSHTAGTTVSGFPGYSASVAVPSVVQVLNGGAPANTRSIVVDTLPGSGFRYSGGGYTVAQLLMTDVTGRSFPDLLRDKVLRPAGMTRSAFAQPLPDDMRSNAATAHDPVGQAIPGKYHSYPELAAAGLWTTPSDLSRFGIEIQRALAGEQGRILSPEMARTMITQQTPSPGPRYALGFALEGEGDSLWFRHGGSNAGFQALFLMSAHQRKGLVVMTNGALGAVLMMEILRSVAQEYGWSRYKAVERDAIRLDSAALAAFVGTFATAPDAPGNPITIEILLEGGQLLANLPAARWTRRAMRASAPDKFFFLASPAELTFERDAAGIVTAMSATGLREVPVRLVRQPSVVVPPGN